jgi:hypothetical protein
MSTYEQRMAEREARVAERERRMEQHERQALRPGGSHQANMRNLTAQNLDSTNYEADWYTYLFNIGSVAGTATVTPNPVQIQADSAFELMQMNITSTLNGFTAPYSRANITPVTIYIQDGGTGRYLMSNPVPAPLICGDGQLPFILPTERIFKPKSTVNLTVQGYTANTYDNVYVAFIGRKLFDYQ